MDGIDVFILGVSTGVLLYAAVSLVKLVGARKDVERYWHDLETIGENGPPAKLKKVSAEYNEAAEWYNDRLKHVPSNLMALAFGYKPAPLIEATSTDANDRV